MIAPPAYPLQFKRRFPFYGWVPKEFRANLRFREAILRAAEDTPEYRADLFEMCRRDFLFWLNTFGWVNEPRNPKIEHRNLPFITRGMQDAAIDKILECIPHRDFLLYKSREVGASWIVMCKAAHDFIFAPATNIGVVSAKEDLVDAPGDNSTLFSKIDYLLDEARYPWWLLPSGSRDSKTNLLYRRVNKLFENPENGSSINGYACTGDVGRGGRKTYFLNDEPAFWPLGQDVEAMDAEQHNTRCRGLLSSPNMPAGFFYDEVRNRGTRNTVVIDMDWRDDPEKAAGLYTSQNDRLQVIDRDFWAQVLKCRTADVETRLVDLEAKYPFVKDGEMRSPYFDYECSRATNKRAMARELNRRFEGTGGPFFSLGTFDKLRQEHARAPVLRGRFGVDPDDLLVRWYPEEFGPTKLWIALGEGEHDHGVKVPEGRKYVVASDVAAGTAGDFSSNSVTVVLDAVNGEQVMEFATATYKPDNFARWNVGICKLFNGAYHIWDAKGTTGSQYTEEMLRLGYGNVYRHTTQQIGAKHKTRKPGAHIQGKEAKAALLSQFEAAAASNRTMIRSDAVYDEVPQYVWKDDDIVHSTSVTTDDASARKSAHGDRVIAYALAVRALGDRPQKEPTPESGPAPYGSLAWRMQEHKRRENEAVSEFEWN